MNWFKSMFKSRRVESRCDSHFYGIQVLYKSKMFGNGSYEVFGKQIFTDLQNAQSKLRICAFWAFKREYGIDLAADNLSFIKIRPATSSDFCPNFFKWIKSPIFPVDDNEYLYLVNIDHDDSQDLLFSVSEKEICFSNSQCFYSFELDEYSAYPSEE